MLLTEHNFSRIKLSFEFINNNLSIGGSLCLEGGAGSRAEVDPRFGLMT